MQDDTLLKLMKHRQIAWQFVMPLPNHERIICLRTRHLLHAAPCVRIIAYRTREPSVPPSAQLQLDFLFKSAHVNMFFLKNSQMVVWNDILLLLDHSLHIRFHNDMSRNNIETKNIKMIHPVTFYVAVVNTE